MNKETKVWIGITAFCVICMIMKLYNEMLLDGLFYFGLSIVGGFLVEINYKNWKNENNKKEKE